ncbi:MAG: hypothetical protein KBD66_02735 [Candidatus Doudnabacteria bacterium]|nr:hypothetical protein [Candidatus Doudnabacteria bacterium]
MNKKIAIGVGVVLVIALLAGYAMRNKDTNQVNSSNTKTEQQVQVNQTTTQQTSLKALMTSGGARTCTYTVGEGMGSAVAFFTNGKMRSDIQVQAGQTNIVSHMLIDGQTSYSWIDGQKTGYKMDLAAMQGNPTKGDINNTGQANIDPNKNFDFKCSDWSVDTSNFAVPTNVEFTDMTKMMQDLPQAPSSGNIPGAVNSEIICGGLQEPAKSQCMSAMQNR